MSVRVEPIRLPEERELLINFLTSQRWPFHVNERLNVDKVSEMIESGIFEGTNHESYWIIDADDIRVGFVRIFDLNDVDDGYPMFDLRLLESSRGQGLGKWAVKWLNQMLFERFPQLDRIVGSTRADNKAMRAVFRSCGYAKEGHSRKAWEGANGELFDSVKYCVLREDWAQGAVTPVSWNDEH